MPTFKLTLITDFIRARKTLFLGAGVLLLVIIIIVAILGHNYDQSGKLSSTMSLAIPPESTEKPAEKPAAEPAPANTAVVIPQTTDTVNGAPVVLTHADVTERHVPQQAVRPVPPPPPEPVVAAAAMPAPAAPAPAPAPKTEPVAPTAPPPKPIAKTVVSKVTKPKASSDSNVYVIQFAAASSDTYIKHFIAQHGLKKQGRVERVVSGGKTWYIAAYGHYPTSQAAQAAIKKLPKNLSDMHPWARNVAGKKAAPQAVVPKAKQKPSLKPKVKPKAKAKTKPIAKATTAAKLKVAHKSAPKLKVASASASASSPAPKPEAEIIIPQITSNGGGDH